MYTVPRSDEETGGTEEGNSGTSTFMLGGIGAIVLIAVLAVTMMMRRGRRRRITKKKGEKVYRVRDERALNN